MYAVVPKSMGHSWQGISYQWVCKGTCDALKILALPLFQQKNDKHLQSTATVYENGSLLTIGYVQPEMMDWWMYQAVEFLVDLQSSLHNNL